MKNNKSLVGIFLIFLLAIILRLVPFEYLTRGSIDFGGNLMISEASVPINQIFKQVVCDQGPLRYYMLHFLLYFGRDEFLVRLPAFIFGVLSVLLVYYLGIFLFDKKVALLTSFLLSVSAWHIHHSLMVRNYTLFSFLVLGEVIFFLRSIKFNRVRDWIFFSLFTSLAFYAFYPSIFILFAEVLWFFFFVSGKRLFFRNISTSLFIIILTFIPSIHKLNCAFYRKLNFGTGHWGWEGRTIFLELLNHFGGFKNFFPFYILIFIISICLLFYFKKMIKETILLILLIIVPIFSYICCFYFFKMSIIARYFLYVYPFYLLIISFAITRIKNIALAVAAVSIFIFPLLTIFLAQTHSLNLEKYMPEDYRRHYVDYERIVSLIKDNYKSIDFVVIESAPGIFGLQYYFDKKNIYPVKSITPSLDSHRYYLYKNERIMLYGMDGDLPRLKRLAERGRLMVIDLGHINYFNSGNEILAWLKENSSKVDSDPGGEIYFIKYKQDEKQFPQMQYFDSDRFLDSKAEVKEIIYPFNRK